MSSTANTSIGIVTALAMECAAMSTMIKQPCSGTGYPGDPNRYITGTIPSADPEKPHEVVLTVMPRDNNKNAAAVCVDLLRTFSGVQCVVMVGIAGGIPSPSAPERHVRLGDVVVATEGVVDYDHVRSVDGSSTVRRHLQGMSMQLVRAAQDLRVAEYSGRRPWQDPLRSAASMYERPPENSDILHVASQPIDHPDRSLSGHLTDYPKIHYAAIASADRLLRDANHRDELARQHHVAAVEMEGSGIATATDLHGVHWFVVRGVADYCDNSTKNDAWHPYASLVAAAYVHALFGQCPPLARPGRVVADGAQVRPMRQAERIRLVNLLLDIPAVAEGPTRQAIVEQLRSDIRDTIRRFPAARPDVHAILSTCFDHRGGIEELIAAVAFFAGDSATSRRAVDALARYVVPDN